MESERYRDRDEDRISNLPEFLIHQILSYLPPKESARTTVLSKIWLQSYSTSSILTFKEFLFDSWQPSFVKNRCSFFSFVNNTLLRYTRLNLHIHKLDINVFHVDHEPAYSLLDKSLGVAFGNGVKELYISVLATIKFSPYTLPSTMFDSPKLLTYLRVSNCKFPPNSKCSAINFPFLKTLHLYLAYIDDGMLQKLLSASPSLEKIVFNQVLGFKKFRVTNLSELNIIDIWLSNETVEIDVEGAPSLQVLNYKVSYIRPCLLKVGSAQNLKCLQLNCVSINDNFIEEIIARSPLLEDLVINSCYGLKMINVASDSLKHFQILRCKKLMEAKIDAPSLLKLEYIGASTLSLSLVNTPEQLMTHITIYNRSLNRLSNEWFYRLRELLKGVNKARVSFSIWHQKQMIKFGIAHDLTANPLPPEHETEYFMPQINQSSSFFAVFVETLFSSSRPATIDECLFLYADFIKFLGSELMAAKRNSNCCSSEQTKCWRHYLKDIEVEVYEEALEVWRTLPQKTSLSEFKFHGKNIRFILKWYANLNAHV